MSPPSPDDPRVRLSKKIIDLGIKYQQIDHKKRTKGQGDVLWTGAHDELTVVTNKLGISKNERTAKMRVVFRKHFGAFALGRIPPENNESFKRAKPKFLERFLNDPVFMTSVGESTLHFFLS